MNRGSLCAEVEAFVVGQASMRPRFMNRGSKTPAAAPLPSPRRFNEAPIHESGKLGGCRLMRKRGGRLQ